MGLNKVIATEFDRSTAFGWILEDKFFSYVFVDRKRWKKLCKQMVERLEIDYGFVSAASSKVMDKLG